MPNLENLENNKVIGFFNKENRFLSNFYPSIVYYDNFRCPDVETAYQIAKTVDHAERLAILHTKSPAEAKRLGQKVTLRSDWIRMKLPVMQGLNIQKYMIPELAEKLLNTFGSELEEGNYWHDNFFGICHCDKCGSIGQNKLGKLLMDIRENILRRK